jgi:hypothetical protein
LQRRQDRTTGFSKYKPAEIQTECLFLHTVRGSSWAITIPLTLSTMAVAIIWGTWRARKITSQVREARGGTEDEKATEAQLLHPADPSSDQSLGGTIVANHQAVDEESLGKNRAHGKVNIWSTLMVGGRRRINGNQGVVSTVNDEGQGTWRGKVKGLGRRKKRRTAAEVIEMRDVEANGVQVEVGNQGRVVNSSQTS